MPKRHIKRQDTFTIDEETAERIRQSKRFKRPVIIVLLVLFSIVIIAGVVAAAILSTDGEVSAIPESVVVNPVEEPELASNITGSISSFWTSSSLPTRIAIIGFPLIILLAIAIAVAWLLIKNPSFFTQFFSQ